MYEKLIGLLEDKEKLIDEFLKFTHLQEEYILNDNYDELSKIVEKKSELIKKINDIDDEFLKEFEWIKQKKNVNSFDEIEDVDREIAAKLKYLTSSIMDKLKIIKEIDEKNTILIRSKFDELKKTIKNVKYKKEAISDYSSYQKSQYRSDFDKKK